METCEPEVRSIIIFNRRLIKPTSCSKRVLEGHRGYVCCCTFWFDKRKQDEYAITGSADRSIKQWRGQSLALYILLLYVPSQFSQ